MYILCCLHEQYFFQHAGEGSNAYSTPNSGWEVLTFLKSGEVLELDVLMATYRRVRDYLQISVDKTIVGLVRENDPLKNIDVLLVHDRP